MCFRVTYCVEDKIRTYPFVDSLLPFVEFNFLNPCSIGKFIWVGDFDFR